MSWLIPLASSVLFDSVAGALFIGILPEGLLPSLGLLWVIVFADRTPSTAARESDMWLNGMMYSAMLGYAHDAVAMSFQAYHLVVYLLLFVVARFFTNRVAQGHRVRIVFVCGLAALGTELAMWWAKHVISGFSSAYIPLAPVLMFAASTALLGALALRRMSKVVDDASAASARRF